MMLWEGSAASFQGPGYSATCQASKRMCFVKVVMLGAGEVQHDSAMQQAHDQPRRCLQPSENATMSKVATAALPLLTCCSPAVYHKLYIVLTHVVIRRFGKKSRPKEHKISSKKGRCALLKLPNRNV